MRSRSNTALVCVLVDGNQDKAACLFTAPSQASAAAIQAEAAARAAAAKAQSEKQVRLDEGSRALGFLRDEFAECTLRQVRDLATSGETAAVLSNAALTLCQGTIDPMRDAMVSQAAIEGGRQPGRMEIDGLESTLKGIFYEQVSALAVQAKAGSGPFRASVNP